MVLFQSVIIIDHSKQCLKTLSFIQTQHLSNKIFYWILTLTIEEWGLIEGSFSVRIIEYLKVDLLQFTLHPEVRLPTGLSLSAVSSPGEIRSQTPVTAAPAPGSHSDTRTVLIISQMVCVL